MSDVQELADEVGFLGRMVLAYARESVGDVFGEYSPKDLQQYIITDYPLVERELTDEHEQRLAEHASGFEPVIREHMTPGEVREWIADPTWVPSERERRELEKCDAVIAETPEGEEWFEEQVYALWRAAGIDPPTDGE